MHFFRKKEHNLPGLEKLRDDPKAGLVEVGDTADLYRLRLLFTTQGGDWLVDRAVRERYSGMEFDK